MTTTEKSIPELLEELHTKMTDSAVGEELGVTNQTIWRWRHEVAAVTLPKLVRAKVLQLLKRRR